MRTSLNGMLCDIAGVLNEHRLSWITVDHVYVSSGWIAVGIKSIEMLGEIAKRLKISRKQIEINPAKFGIHPNQICVEFKARGIRWYCNTDAPPSQVELLGVDGESITALPKPKRLGLPARKKPDANGLVEGGQS